MDFCTLLYVMIKILLQIVKINIFYPTCDSFSFLVLAYPLPNMALDRKTAQSTNAPAMLNLMAMSSKAVSGCRSSTFYYECCTRTLPLQSDPWWSVDLSRVYKVSAATLTFHCAEMKGRYVHVIISGNAKTLALCEVEVYAHHEGAVYICICCCCNSFYSSM
uniref:Fucolectin tachylectin-4 pentraxin-1 domain-containing protein n=1 Tax=Mola mola TaxID=94237 RepID=A0A3Q3XM84_MOLML